MSYTIQWDKQAVKSLNKIPKQYQGDIKNAIGSLRTLPRPNGCKKLSSGENYRIRVGKYRIIYSIEDSKLVICVLLVSHRKDAYR